MKRSRSKCRITDLTDPWYVIIEFLESSEDFFSLISASKDIKGFLEKSKGIASKIRFSLRNEKSILDGKPVFFVHSLFIKMKVESQGLFSKGEYHNNEMLPKILKKFPFCEDLKIKKTTAYEVKTVPRIDLHRHPRTQRVEVPLMFSPSVLKKTKLQILSLSSGCVANLNQLLIVLKDIPTFQSLSLVNFKSFTFFHNPQHGQTSIGDLHNLRNLLMKNVYTDQPIIKNSPSLQNLTVKNCGLQIFSKDPNFPKLKSIEISDRSINEDFFLRFVSPLIKNQCLEIIKMKGLVGSSKSNGECLDVVLRNNVKMKVLCIPEFDFFDGSMFNPGFLSCNILEKLNIMGCKRISGIMMREAFEKHPNNNLKELNISHCCGEGFDDLLLRCFPKLKCLIMEGCSQETITDFGFENLTKLEYLNIYQCTQQQLSSGLISTLFKNNSRLKKIVLLEDFKGDYYEEYRSYPKEIDREMFFSGTFEIRRKLLRYRYLSDLQVVQEKWIWIIPNLDEDCDFSRMFCERCDGFTRGWKCDVCGEKECSVCLEPREIFEVCESCGNQNVCESCFGEECGVCEKRSCTHGDCVGNEGLTMCDNWLCGCYFCAKPDCGEKGCERDADDDEEEEGEGEEREEVKDSFEGGRDTPHESHSRCKICFYRFG